MRRVAAMIASPAEATEPRMTAVSPSREDPASSFVSPRVPELGDYVDLVFTLPGDRRDYRVRGSVVFIDDSPAARKAGFGTRFERPPAALLDAIKNLSRGH